MSNEWAEFGERVRQVLPPVTAPQLTSLGVRVPTPPFGSSVVDDEGSVNSAVPANTRTIVFSEAITSPDPNNARILLAVVNLLISYSLAGLVTIEIDGLDETVGGSWSLSLPLSAPDYHTCSLYVPGTLPAGGLLTGVDVAITSSMACTVLNQNPNMTPSPSRSGSRFTVYML